METTKSQMIYSSTIKKKCFADVDKMVSQAKRLKLKDRELTDYIDKEINKKKNPFVPDIEKRFMAGEFKKEDAPTNFAGAGSGVDFNPTGLSMKKKKELDARTKEYRLHRRKLEQQREKRKLKAQKTLCGNFRKSVKENTDKNPAMYTKLIDVLINLFIRYNVLIVTYILSSDSRS